MYDIVVVGGGTAGLSAAIYGVRSGKTVLVLERGVYGGQIINSPEVENYPGIRKISGAEFARGLYEQATELGAKFSQGHVVRIEEQQGIKTVYTQDGTEQKQYETRAVILATGVRNRPLGVDREEDLIGAGISYCATCDGMFFRGREVAVVGGGNTALEDAVFLSNYCSQVYLIHRRDKFRGEESQVRLLRQKENVTFVFHTTVAGLKGEDTLEAVVLKDTLTGEERQLAVSGLFVAIGKIADNVSFDNLVDLDETGYIRAAEDCRTDTAGVFAAGDCRTKTVRQLATAAADGAVAALAACEYLEEVQG